MFTAFLDLGELASGSSFAPQQIDQKRSVFADCVTASADGNVKDVHENQIPPGWPVALGLFGHGTQVVICSDVCMDRLEADRYPGLRFARMARPPIVSPWCIVCAVCGRRCIERPGCALHDGRCPGVQWRLTFQGLDATATALELFAPDEADRLLDLLERYMLHRPGVDPVVLLMKLARR